MLPVNGFFGHIQKNHARSLVMFMGFMLSMHITMAAIHSIPLPVWRHIPSVFNDPINYFKSAGLLVTAISFIIFVIFYYSHVFLLRWTIGFEKLDLNTNPRLHQITQNLANIAGIPVPELNYIPSPALNSFASGLSKGHAQIIVTQGLIEALDDEELEAVIAHEIAHIKNGDMHMMAVANAAIGSVKLINFINPMKFTFFKHIPPLFFFLALPILLPLFVLTIFYSFIMQLTSLIATATRYVISSSREYIADAEAVRLTHNPAALVSALSKIHGRSNLHCTDSVANAMMIDGPSSGKNASHPTIQSRVEMLAQLSGSMIHASGVRKDTRQRSLNANAGNAYGAGAYSSEGFGKRSFSQGFARVSEMTSSNVNTYVPASPDYAQYQGKTFKTATHESFWDRINQGNDAEYGIDQQSRWMIIVFLSLFIFVSYTNKQKARIEKENRPPASFIKTEISTSPVFAVLNFDGRSSITKSLNQSKVYMDFDNTQKHYRTGWLNSADAFLYHDKNGNNKMDGMDELLSMPLKQAKRANNFYPLVRFDNNADRIIDKRDPRFSHIKAWRDFDRDGVFDSDESFTLKSLDIQSFNLNVSLAGPDKAKTPEGITTASGARIIRKSEFIRGTGSRKKHVTGLMLMAFETDISRYKTAAGELIIPALQNDTSPAAVVSVTPRKTHNQNHVMDVPNLRSRN